jgi:hypothetical protein
MNTGIRVQSQYEHVAQGPGLFEKPDMTGVQQIVAAIGENDELSLPLPELALGDQFGAGIKPGHRSSV